jgi:protein-disulfide isomerase
MSKQIKFIIGIVGLIIVVFFIAKADFKNKEVKKEVTDVNQTAILEIKANDWAVGQVDAKVTLVEYLDFECEACGAYYPLTTQLKEEYKDSIRFVVRYFPLPGHKNSRTAAHAVEAAGKQGKFWEMYGILFTNQKDWGEGQTANQEQFEKYAMEAGVNIEQWRKDVASPEVAKRVEDSYKEAVSLGLQGTPSFFLNGKKIANPQGYDAFKKLIDESLK